MSKGFVALAARRDENRIAADERLVGRFSGMRLKGALPQNRLRVLQVALNEQLEFFVRCGEVNDGHLAAQAMQSVIAGGYDAAGGIQDKFARGVVLQTGENLVKHSDFFGEVLSSPLRVVRTVRPTHPCRDTVDSAKAACVEGGSEARFDLIVAANGGTTESGEVFCPVRFAGTGHADESET